MINEEAMIGLSGYQIRGIGWKDEAVELSARCTVGARASA